MSKAFEVDLSGRVAVVTGGGGVLCGSMAEALASAGAKVAVADLREAAAQAVADRITAAGGTAIGVVCNVLDAQSIAAANARTEAELGPVDILINGAGGNHPKGTTSREHLVPEDLTHPRDSHAVDAAEMPHARLRPDRMTAIIAWLSSWKATSLPPVHTASQS